jgi:uncharacterized protein YcbX
MDAVVGSLFVYPVKSCRGIAVDEAEVDRRGLRHDRRWMIVDAAGEFVTQRTEPRLALVDVVVDLQQAALKLSAPGQNTLTLDLLPREGARVCVRVWRDEVEALDAGDEATRWASTLLGAPGSIVFMPEDVERALREGYGQPGDAVGFADAFPLMMTTTASLEDLNARMDVPLPMNRFRPNIVLEGCSPWAEDTWRRARLGKVAVRLPKGCDRCVITTIDQRTATPGVEPLRTLSSFRKIEGKVYFGVNAIPDGRGRIRVGDPVTVLE